MIKHLMKNGLNFVLALFVYHLAPMSARDWSEATLLIVHQPWAKFFLLRSKLEHL